MIPHMRIRFLLLSALAVTAFACVQPAPIQAPAPVQLQSSRAPATVVTAAAQHLVAQGFDIVTSDATAGLLTARRTQSPQLWASAIRCRFGTNTLAHSRGNATYTVTVTAAPATAGTSVTVQGRVRMSYQNIPGISAGMTAPDSDTDCGSTGVVEQQLAQAISGTT